MTIRDPRVRYSRRRSFDGVGRGRLPRLTAWADQEADDLSGTATGFAVAKSTGDTSLEATAHGLTTGQGPFYATTTDTLPTGMVAATPYYVGEVVDANNFRLRSGWPVGEVVEAADAGVGTHTLTRGEAALDIVRSLARNAPSVIGAATDVDDLA